MAARNQQSQLAVALAEEFARRFPRDRDLVLNGLTAAKLMDRLDRDDEARRLLTDLLARFPEHELRPELETAHAHRTDMPIAEERASRLIAMFTYPFRARSWVG